MKALFSFLALFFMLSPVFAQDETLLGGNIEHGAYFAPTLRVSQIGNDNIGMLAGGYGGWLLDHRLLLGIGGYGLVSNHFAPHPTLDYYKLTEKSTVVAMGYGGFVLEYTFWPNKLVHMNINLLLGAGAVNIRYSSYFANWYEWSNYSSWYLFNRPDVFFVIEPGIQAELNFTPWMRAFIGGNARFVTDIDQIEGMTNSMLSGFSGSIGVKFGWF